MSPQVKVLCDPTQHQGILFSEGAPEIKMPNNFQEENNDRTFVTLCDLTCHIAGQHESTGCW